MELLQFLTLLYSALEEVSAEYDAPAALPREQKSPLFFDWGHGCLGQKVRLENLEKGKVFSPTEFHNTNARLPNHYLIYCTKCAIRSITYEFIYFLSRMFISCWFAVNLTAKNYFFDFIFSLPKSYVLLITSGAAALTERRNVRALAKLTAGREGSYFAFPTGWRITKLLKTN